MQDDSDFEMNDENEPSETGARVQFGGGGTSQSVQSLLANMNVWAMQSAGDQRVAGGRGPSLNFGLRGITVADLRSLLNPGALDLEDDEDDEDYRPDQDSDDESAYYDNYRPRQWFPPVLEPQDEGVELLKSGDFGRVGTKMNGLYGSGNLARTIINRSTRPQPYPALYKEDYASKLVPNCNGTAVAAYDANIYTGQYSKDSSFYYTCSQDFRLHLFDTTQPPLPDRIQSRRGNVGAGHQDPYLGLETTMTVKKRIQASPGRWTITDANLSPNNERMVYSSIISTAFVTSTVDDNPIQHPIKFADRTRLGNGFGIYSCRFSADGNEVVAGGNGLLFVYDLLADRRTVKISAHADDVNSVCWADSASGNVLISASDDTFLKVWDRRSLGASQRPSGVLVGHTEGITYVSAKGDGRYVVSNGKDQAARLWDLRKMRSSAEFDKIEGKRYGANGFDYRYPPYPKPKHKAHPQDCSVMTYRGHSVLQTLIRCHFSPAETTGGQYIYSGSADGKIHIWSLDGTVAQVLDRSKTLPMSFDPSAPEPQVTLGARHHVCVRDVSWHSQQPILMSAGWESIRGGSVVAKHEWKGLSKMGHSLEDWTEKERLEQRQREATAQRRSARVQQGRDRRAVSTLMPGSFGDSEEEEE